MLLKIYFDQSRLDSLLEIHKLFICKLPLPSHPLKKSAETLIYNKWNTTLKLS